MSTPGAVVAVVGSANLDLVARTASLPSPGETVLSDSYAEFAGGKGLNQAIAAARTMPTVLVAALGDDAAGTVLRDAVTEHGIRTDCLAGVDAPSGRALIAVDAQAENLIVVVSGANARLSGNHVTECLGRVGPAVVLAQSEVPTAAVRAAADWCAATSTRFAWNASPVGAIEDDVLALCDPLIVNAAEAVAICAALGHAASDAPSALASLRQHCRSVVVTDGARGALVAGTDVLAEVPAVEASAVVDTTGAGDELAGALVAALAHGATLDQACRTAVRAAAVLIATARSDR